ncbi:MAG: hypothetical protein KBE09_01350 [Candidatus Pacebacteria bacterium]|nr:hypothetical protein [Candidatus Paceibacterota bacterium]
MKTSLLSVMVACLFALPAVASADITSDIQVREDGTFIGKNIKVMQKADGNLFTRATWSLMYVRITVITAKDTVFLRAYGEPATVNDIKEGDLIDIEGKLSSGEGVLVIKPTKIRNVSLMRADKDFKGKVTGVSLGDQTMNLIRPDSSTTTLKLTATTTISKGVRLITAADVQVGDSIVSAQGEYDYKTNTLKARKIEVYQDPTVFSGKNFQGTLKALSASTPPTVATVTIEGSDYLVYLPVGTTVLNTAKKPAQLARFVVGDTVRLFGAIRPANLKEIDAEVIRDLAF